MKLIYTFLFALAFINAGAQIPNPDFESWMNGSPAAWITSNDSLPGSIVQSDSAYNGSSALQINVVALNDSGKNAGGFAYTDNQGNGNPDPSVPLLLLGWYRLKSPGNDVASVSVSVYSNGYIVGSGLTELAPQDTGYREFEVEIDYGGTFSTIDYSNISFQFETPPAFDSLHAGSQLTVDDLSYGYNASAGISPVSGNKRGIKLVYPNPSNDLSNIAYSVPDNVKVNLALYDILGRQKEVLINEMENRGEYNMQLNTGGFSDGLYFLRLLMNNELFIAPLTINR